MKTFIRNNALSATIVLFVLLFSLIKIAQPAFIFNKNGSIRNFGIGKIKKTIIPIWLVTIILAIFSYIFVMFYVSQ